MCLVKPKQNRPSPAQVKQDPDYIKLTGGKKEFQKQLDQQEDDAMKTMMMFNYNARNKGGNQYKAQVDTSGF